MELVARTVVEIGARKDGWWKCVWPGTNTEHITFGNSHVQSRDCQLASPAIPMCVNDDHNVEERCSMSVSAVHQLRGTDRPCNIPINQRCQGNAGVNGGVQSTYPTHDISLLTRSTTTTIATIIPPAAWRYDRYTSSDTPPIARSFTVINPLRVPDMCCGISSPDFLS